MPTVARDARGRPAEPPTAAPAAPPGAPARGPAPPAGSPAVDRLLAAAVAALGGTFRPGQQQMAQAVADAIARREHLLVQAGTGTGKSLGYLVPALLHAIDTGTPVVVATATLALQAQLVRRDLPLLADAAAPLLPRRPDVAVLKGRSNYACLHRVRDGVPSEQGVLVEQVPTGPLGREVLALRDWAAAQAVAGGTGDRDDAPPHGDRAWAQVSVTARECLGRDRCPYGAECFAERARDRAMAADVVVTNHALLAIDAVERVPVLPDHDVVVVDEAHELPARVTGAASAELSAPFVERAARQARPFASGPEADALGRAGEALRDALAAASEGRVEALDGALGDAVRQVRDAARSTWSAFPREADEPDREAARRQARTQLEDVRDIADRVAAGSELDVRWVAVRERGGAELRVAPLSVAGLLRDLLFRRTTCVLTSATLTLGGGFGPLGRQVGLRESERVAAGPAPQPPAPVGSGPGPAPQPRAPVGSGPGPEPQPPAPVSPGSPEPATGSAGGPEPAPKPARASAPAESAGAEPVPWRGLDVGSPFDYPHRAILYVARRLPPPGRDGPGERLLAELCDLVDAAGGRTLGLFSSRRAAEQAAAVVRERLHRPVLCQGEAPLARLHERFVAEPETSLFGTLSLWQGVDTPGETCQLVVIDRIPFPRPDDPLMSARQRAVDGAGGNGFLAVAATHAALLLAQGTGRLIRRASDRGVVAILDPRLVTARYGAFLGASLPPMWRTVDRDVVLAALRRLATSAASAASAANAADAAAAVGEAGADAARGAAPGGPAVAPPAASG